MYKVIFFVGLAISLVSAKTEILDGPCPSSEVEAIKNFDQEQFLDKWYVIQRYEKNGMDCVTVSYGWQSLRRQLSETLREGKLEEGEQSVGVAVLVEQERLSDDGKLQFRGSKNSHYYIVDTDYHKYAVVWTCFEQRTTHTENLMVLARDRDFDINSMESLNATLAKQPLDRSKLNYIEQKDERCTCVSV